MLARYNRTGDTTDEAYWDHLGQEYMQAFQDTASRERAEEKLKHLSFIPGDVDTFIAQFRTLADEAMYPIDAKPTISLFASKLPYKMMEHIYKITRPGFQWMGRRSKAISSGQHRGPKHQGSL